MSCFLKEVTMRKRTVCRLCSACCLVEVEVEAGRLVAAERLSPAPPAQRRACPKLAAAPEIVHSPERLRRPLLRQPGAPPGRFQEASWDEALSLVAHKFRECRERYGAPSVAWLRGMAADWGAPWDYANRLMNAFGSPNTVGNGSVCHVAREMAHVYTFGAMTIPQIRDSGCVVVWGKCDPDTNPPAAEAIFAARARGARLIVVDPVRTELAAQADIWLQVKPGHDGALAMAMIREIMDAGLCDQAFLDQWAVGLEDLRRAAAFAPERIAAGIWLEPGLIKAAARLYAETKPACIVEGNGLDMQLHTFEATRAVCILRAVTGNLDIEGGDLLPQLVPSRPMQLRERLPKDAVPVTAAYPLFNTFHPTWGLNAQSCVVDAILDERPYPVKLLVVQSGNPAVTMTDSRRVRRALEKLDFLVVMDPFFTRTAELAHVVLPAALCFEKTQLNRAFLRHNTVVLQDKVLPCQHESRPDWQIIFELAGRLGLKEDFPWETVEEAIDFQLAPAGITVEMLRQEPAGIAVSPTRYRKYQLEGFATPSGKVEISSERLRQAGHEAVPYARGWPGDPISFADRAAEFPFIGMSGRRSSNYTHTQFHKVGSLRQREPQGFADLHPADAAALGIADGQLVRVVTPKGEVRCRVRMSEVVHKGAVRLPWGWGDLEAGLNVNDLTDDDRRNAVTATPSARTFMCRVEKAEA